MAEDMTMINPINYVIKREYDSNYVVKEKLFKKRLSFAKNLYRKDLLAHYGCVNAIEFSNEGELLVSGGDDRRVLLWSISKAIHDKCTPISMQTSHVSNIFCLSFDSTNSKIYSGGNDDQVIVHDAKTGQLITKISHKKPVYGLSVNPRNDFVLSTAGDDGRILVYDIRESNSDPMCLAKQKTGFHSVMYNPNHPNLLATANSEDGVVLWDTRKPKQQLIHYDSDSGNVSGISASFNSSGTHLLALRRRLPPVLYKTDERNAICQFYHPQYYNSCTMKTCSFAGENDEYVLSGSDDFNLYMWKIPEDNCEWGKCHMVLNGHRSIVNQVRYNKNNNFIASSGVEKMIKLWSTLPIGNWKGSLLKEITETQRNVYTHEDYMYLVGHTGQRISHDYSDHSTQEDCRMMAFFDSLIQREIEGWNSPSDENLTSESDSSDNNNTQTFRRKFSWEQLLGAKKLQLDDVTSTAGGKKIKANRIAQLIAQKRQRLAKMAQMKSCSLLVNKTTTSRDNSRRKRKNVSKTSKFKTKCNNGNNTKKCLKNLKQMNNATNAKQPIEKQKNVTLQPQPKKYLTRNTTREMAISNNNNNCMDVPSTSTGITGTSTRLFRLVEQQDSEEEADTNTTGNGATIENNLVNILPTPLNGTHDMFINVLEMNRNNNNGNNTVETNDLLYNNGQQLQQQYNNNNNNSDSDSNFENEYTTPVKKKKCTIYGEIDSGFGTSSGPSSSSSSVNGNNTNKRNYGPCSSKTIVKRNNNNDSSDDDCHNHSNNYRQQSSDNRYETFKRRAVNKKARINVRKQLCADSDSN